MGILKINYQAAIDLGFKRIDSPDPVWFEENGYDYFIVEKELGPNGTLYWNPQDHQIEICLLNDDNVVIERKTLTSFAELDSLILLGNYFQKV